METIMCFRKYNLYHLGHFNLAGDRRAPIAVNIPNILTYNHGTFLKKSNVYLKRLFCPQLPSPFGLLRWTCWMVWKKSSRDQKLSREVLGSFSRCLTRRDWINILLHWFNPEQFVCEQVKVQSPKIWTCCYRFRLRQTSGTRLTSQSSQPWPYR